MITEAILKRVRTQDGSLPPTYAEVARAAWAATSDLTAAVVALCNASGLPRGYILNVLTEVAYKEFGGLEPPDAPPPLAETGETRAGATLACGGLPVAYEPCTCWHGDYNHPPETCDSCDARTNDDAEYAEFVEFVGGDSGVEAIDRLYDLAFKTWKASQTRTRPDYNPFADEDGEAADCTQDESFPKEAESR